MPENSTGWLSAALKWPSLLIFGIFDVTLLVTVISLLTKSSAGNGFVTVSALNLTSTGAKSLLGKSSKSSDGFSELGVLWTTLPSLVFALFSAYWGWVACAISDRQPYVDLRKAEGSKADCSILLDYRLFPSPWRWWKAFQRSHNTVGATSLLSLMLAYVMAPFAARLFATKVITDGQSIPISYNTTFNDSNLGPELDWRPVLETVAATVIYHGNNIAWTDDEHAFQPFYIATQASEAATVEANTSAYAAYLNCEAVQDYTMSFTLQETDKGYTMVSGNDRGCDFDMDFAVSREQKLYFRTKAVVTCSESAYYSRIILLAARYSASAPKRLKDISVISCAIGYQKTSGLLRISSAATSPTIQSFTATGKPDTTRPYLWRVIEQAILAPVTFNPQASTSMTDFGSLVLYFAQKLHPSNPIDTDILKRSISDIFTAVYVNAIAMQAFDEAENAEMRTGQVFVPINRLYVVPWVAYIIVLFLFLALCSVAFVFTFVRKTPSILDEEPIGLLSMAAILYESEVMKVASDIRRGPEFNGEVATRAQELPEVIQVKWKAERDDGIGGWIIRSHRSEEVSGSPGTNSSDK